MGTRTEAVTLFSYTVTTDKASFTATGYAGRRLSALRPPYTLSWKSENAGATAPSGTISMIARLQDSDDNSTFDNVTAFTVTAITAAGAREKTKTYTSQLRYYVRILAKTLAAGTWANGSNLTAILTGTVGD
jgi:hypothetical protein